MPQVTPSTVNSPTASTETDIRLMRRALELANQGVGQVSPGPLVGCVIADQTGEIVGEGFYVYEKLKHAETYALEQAGARAKGATAYVSLEPHAHFGRTSPCTDALLNAGIARVVFPIEDPNPKVSGKGIQHLQAAGVDVSVGLMAREAERVNEKYIHFMKTGRPFVHLKMAASLDGKIATRTGDSHWITGPEARQRVHELRHECDAILVGAGTACTDDPLLTDRSGRSRRQPLVRVVLDDMLKLAADSRLAITAGESPVIVFASNAADDSRVRELEARGVQVVRQDAKDPNAVLSELGQRAIQSVLVEGGSTVAGNLFDAGLVNKVSFFVAPMIIGGREAPTAIGGEGAQTLADAFELEELEIISRGRDLEVTGYPKRKHSD